MQGGRSAARADDRRKCSWVSNSAACGLLLATPLMAATVVLVKMLYVEETLGDAIDTPQDDLKRQDIPTVPGETLNHQDTKNTKN